MSRLFGERGDGNDDDDGNDTEPDAAADVVAATMTESWGVAGVVAVVVGGWVVVVVAEEAGTIGTVEDGGEDDMMMTLMSVVTATNRMLEVVGLWDVSSVVSSVLSFRSMIHQLLAWLLLLLLVATVLGSLNPGFKQSLNHSIHHSIHPFIQLPEQACACTACTHTQSISHTDILCNVGYYQIYRSFRASFRSHPRLPKKGWVEATTDETRARPWSVCLFVYSLTHATQRDATQPWHRTARLSWRALLAAGTATIILSIFTYRYERTYRREPSTGTGLFSFVVPDHRYSTINHGRV